MAKSTAAKLNYEALNTELVEVLEQLESGNLGIDSAVAAYARGMAIVKQLEEYLLTAQNRVEELRAQVTATELPDADGK